MILHPTRSCSRELRSKLIAKSTEQHLIGEGLFQDLSDAKFGSAALDRGIGGRRDHNYCRDLAAALTQFSHYLQTVQPRHVIVDD